MSKKPPRSWIKQEHVLGALTAAYPHVKRRDWRNQALALLAPDPDDGELDGFESCLRDFGYEPDAYAIEKELRELVFFEVEVHNLLSDLKLQAYGKLTIDLGYYDVTFGLMTINKHGHINEIHLLHHYVDWLKEASK